MSFAGAKVLSLESRRSKEIAQLIRNHQGDPFVAPSMREAPLDRNDAAFQFAEKLFAGGFDMVVLLTGVGTRLLDQVLATRYAAGRFAEALRGLTVVARGPKPMAVLRLSINISKANSSPLSLHSRLIKTACVKILLERTGPPKYLQIRRI